MKENKNKNKKDKRSLVNKGERLLLKLYHGQFDQKTYDKAQSFYNKARRKKSRKHAKKFGYSGGLGAAFESFDFMDGKVYERHLAFFILP